MSQLWKPLPYMKKAVQFLLTREAGALFAGPGSRKTSITYSVLSTMKKAGTLRGALVVAPRRPANMVWMQERDKWTNFHDLSVAVLHGAGKEHLAEVRHDVFVVTYSGFQWLEKSGLLAKMFRKKWLNVLVLDELSNVKTMHSTRASTMRKWLPRFDKRIGLTGSPASNGYMDLFGEIYALDLGHAFGQFITHFRWNFFTPVGDGDYPTYVPKPGAKELIFERLKHVAMRIDPADHMKLPQIVENSLRFELPPKVQKEYDRMEGSMFAELEEGGLVTAVSAAVASMKCRQITSGAIYEDKVDPITGMPRTGKRVWHHVHDEKIELLDELVKELAGQQLLVGIEFDHERERILKHFGKDTPCIVGGTSDKKAKMYGDAWNAGDIPLLIGHPGSMGHGLNFQESHAYNVAWFSGTWNFELYDQFIRRLLRSGNNAPHLFVHRFLAKDTVDEAVRASNHRKDHDQNVLFDAIKAYQKGKKR